MYFNSYATNNGISQAIIHGPFPRPLSYKDFWFSKTEREQGGFFSLDGRKREPRKTDALASTCVRKARDRSLTVLTSERVVGHLRPFCGNDTNTQYECVQMPTEPIRAVEPIEPTGPANDIQAAAWAAVQEYRAAVRWHPPGSSLGSSPVGPGDPEQHILEMLDPDERARWATLPAADRAKLVREFIVSGRNSIALGANLRNGPIADRG
jgi:hypothetical protein